MECVGGVVSLRAEGTEQDVSNAPGRPRVCQVESGASLVGRGSQTGHVQMVDEYFDNVEKENSASQGKNALRQTPNEQGVQMVDEPGYVTASMVRELL